MPDLRRVGLIFRREMRDALRDRRTVFMVLVLPILLYPAIMLGGVQIMGVAREVDSRKTYGLMVAGIPVDRLTERDPADKTPPDADARLRVVPMPAGWTMKDVESRLLADGAFEHVTPAGETVVIHAFARATIPLELFLLPGPPPKLDADHVPVEIVFNGRNADSLTAARRARDLISDYRGRLFAEALAKIEGTSGAAVLARRITVNDRNLQKGTGQLPRTFIGALAMLLVLMSLTGAFYPAVDLVAGEKERGTIETLLIGPVTRLEALLGKFGTVWAFSVTTAMLNLASLGLTFWYVMSIFDKAAKGMPEGFLPENFNLTPAALLWILLMLLPLSALFSALALALSAYARSAKEGQYYLSPLFLLVMPPAMIASMPETELSPFKAQVPVLGPALALKEMLLAGHPGNFRWEMIIPALATTFGYSALAIWWGLRQFERESVLFREAEEFSLGLWLKRQLTLPRVLPRGGDAAFLFTFCLAAFWFIGVLFSLFVPNPVAATALGQLLLLLVPTLVYAGVLRGTAGLNLRETFSLRLCKPWALVLIPPAAAAALVLVHAAAQLANDAGWLPVPARAQEEMQKLIAGVPIWLRVLVFAGAPAVCEELLCRGFLLAGLRGKAAAGASTKAVVGSAVMFGLLHFLGTPLQMAYAALLGLLLGRLLIRTGGIVYPMLFHLTFNGLSVTSDVLLADLPPSVQAAFAKPDAVSVVIAAAVLIGVIAIIELAFRPTAPSATGEPSATDGGQRTKDQ